MFVFCVLTVLSTIIPSSSASADVQSLHITSDIKYRFATTLVSSVVTNQDLWSQEAVFDVTLPNGAFITKFTLEINGTVYPGIIKEKEAAKQQYVAAKQREESAALISERPRETNKFNVEVNVASSSSVSFNLTYQELLQRKHGQYEHVIYINPGQPVQEMGVRVSIQESREITYVGVPPLRNDIPDENEADPAQQLTIRQRLLKLRKAGVSRMRTGLNKLKGWWSRKVECLVPHLDCVNKSNSIAIIEQPTTSSAFIQFYPSIEEQTISNSQGLAGQFVVQYNVDREHDAGDVLVVNGYFVHFFAPAGYEAFPKDVLFVLDKSGSMTGRKTDQLKEAMGAILDSLHEGDRINILTFSSSTALWKKQMMWATLENMQQARTHVKNIQARGGTNIEAALLESISLLKALEDMDGRSQAIIFLTDGQPTVGETNTDRLLTNILQANDKRIPIFSLAFGQGADFDFVKQVALQNSGFGRKIYEASDAALQIADFYDEISETLLQNLTFKYIGGEDEEAAIETTVCTFDSYFEGSELIVAGKLRHPEQKTVTVKIDSNSVEGNIILTSDTGIDIPDFGQEANLTHIADFGKITEKMWAYLTIKQTLEKAEASTDPADRETLEKKALNLSLQYQFVTEKTSMVVTKPPEMTSENSTQEMVDVLEEYDVTAIRGIGPKTMMSMVNPAGLGSGGMSMTPMISGAGRRVYHSPVLQSAPLPPRRKYFMRQRFYDVGAGRRVYHSPVLQSAPLPPRRKYFMPQRFYDVGYTHTQSPAPTDLSIRRSRGRKKMAPKRKNEKTSKSKHLSYGLRTKFPGIAEPLCLQIQDKLSVWGTGHSPDGVLLLSTQDCRVTAEHKKNDRHTSIVEFTAVLVRCSRHQVDIRPDSLSYNISGPEESASVIWDDSVALGFARTGIHLSMTEFYIEISVDGEPFRVEKQTDVLGVYFDMEDVSLPENSDGLLGHFASRRVRTLKTKRKKGVKVAKMILEGALLHNSRHFFTKLTDTPSSPAASECWWILNRFQDRFVGNLKDYRVTRDIQ